MVIRIENYTINIIDEVTTILASQKQVGKFDNERGGILLGKVYGTDIHVLKISLPTELDKSGRFFFERHRLSAKLIVEYEFHNSNGQMLYLGEWHTHPEAHPTPSDQDRQMIKEQFKNNKIQTTFLLLFIQGTDRLYTAVYNKQGLTSANIKT